MQRIAFNRLREIQPAHVAIDKQDRGEELLVILFQLTEGQRGCSPRVVPVEKEFAAAIPINEGWRFMDHDEKRWIQRPTFLLARQIVFSVGCSLQGLILPKVAVKPVSHFGDNF